MKAGRTYLNRFNGNCAPPTRSLLNILIQTLLPLLIVAVLASGFFPTSAAGKEDPLTPVERAWLDRHDGKIAVNREAGRAPIIDADKDGNSFGIVIDYQRLLEKKLDFTFKQERLDNWQNFMERFRNCQIDVSNHLEKTPERSEYALFTTPYIKIPNAIIVRNEIKKDLVLENMQSMRIAVTRNFAIHDYLKTRYPDLELSPQDRDLDCLLEITARRADAAVVNLAVASFIIEKMGITNLRIAGFSGYDNALCFASRKDWPILNRILEKGLALITPEERDVIHAKWISLEYSPFYRSCDFRIFSGSFIFIVFSVILAILFWNRSLRRPKKLLTETIDKTSDRLKKEIEERLQSEGVLRESEGKLRAVLDSTPFPVAVVDLQDNQIFFWSRSALSIFGHTAPTASEWYEIAYPDPEYRQKVIERWNYFLEIARRSGQPVNAGEYRVTCKDGSVRTCELHVSFIPDNLIVTFNDITDRKLAEETLVLFKYAVESATDAIGMSTAEGRHYYQNQAFSKLFGWIGEHPQATLYVDEDIGKEVFASIMDGREWFGEVQMYAADRTILDILLRAYSIRDNNGSIIGLVGVHTDISDRKKSEQALKESEVLFRALFEQAAVGVSQVESKTGRFIRINQRYCDIVGYSKEEMTGKSFQAITHPDDLEEDLNNMQKLLGGEIREFSMEKRYSRRDGSVVWVNLSVSSMWQPGEEPDYHIAVIEDITDRKEAESNLAQEKERLLVTLRSIGDGVITTDTSGRVVMINKIAEMLTGWSQPEAVGKDIAEVFNIFNANTRQPCENPVEKVMKAETIVGLSNHTNLVARDGTERLIADSGAPIFDTTNEIIGVVLVFRDVTEKYRIERQLQQAQKIESIGILAGGIAHDFNNMLGVIIGNVSHALSRIKPDEELSDVLRDVQKSANQAQSLTQQLLTFAKGGAPVKKVADLNQIIRESARFVTRGGKTRCEFQLADDLQAVEVDPGQISQVINNLVINACQAMPDGGIIRIQTEHSVVESGKAFIADLSPGQYVKITIADQGIGISDKHISKIFDPYFTTKQKGSGLGLAMAYSIITKHGGCLTVDSEIGRGTVFHVFIPASSEALPQTEYREKSIHQGHGKILIMDDQKIILMMAERVLHRMGYETVCAEDGARAIELYREAFLTGNPFDLVILDLTIPGGMGGAETIPELLKIDPNVKAVVSSGYSTDPIMANYRDYGFCAVMPKPYTIYEFSDMLDKIRSDWE